MNAGWADILAPGERVLWQGQPDRRVPWRGGALPFAAFGLIFAGFAVFWMIMAARSGAFWAFGLIHFFAGLVMAFGPLLIGPYIAHHTWYSLSNRRAFFANDLPLAGKTLLALDLRPSLGVEFDGGDPGTIRFDGRAEPIYGARFDSTPSFSKIHDARTVFGLIRDIQKGSV